METVRVVEREFEIALYKAATETVRDELFALCCGNGEELWSALEDIARVAMARCKGKLSVYGRDVYCDGLVKFSSDGQTLFHRSGLVSGWHSWLVRGYGAWLGWERIEPVIVIVKEDLRFNRRLSWESSEHSTEVKSVSGGIVTAVVDGEIETVAFEQLLSFVAVHGLRTKG